MLILRLLCSFQAQEKEEMTDALGSESPFPHSVLAKQCALLGVMAGIHSTRRGFLTSLSLFIETLFVSVQVSCTISLVSTVPSIHLFIQVGRSCIALLPTNFGITTSVYNKLPVRHRQRDLCRTEQVSLDLSIFTPFPAYHIFFLRQSFS